MRVIFLLLSLGLVLTCSKTPVEFICGDKLTTSAECNGRLSDDSITAIKNFYQQQCIRDKESLVTALKAKADNMFTSLSNVIEKQVYEVNNGSGVVGTITILHKDTTNKIVYFLIDPGVGATDPYNVTGLSAERVFKYKLTDTNAHIDQIIQGICYKASGYTNSDNNTADNFQFTMKYEEDATTKINEYTYNFKLDFSMPLPFMFFNLSFTQRELDLDRVEQGTSSLSYTVAQGTALTQTDFDTLKADVDANLFTECEYQSFAFDSDSDLPLKMAPTDSCAVDFDVP